MEEQGIPSELTAAVLYLPSREEDDGPKGTRGASTMP